MTTHVLCVPEELKRRPQWVCWKPLPSGSPGDKPRKVLFDPRSDRPADASDLATWATFDEALNRYERGGYAGVGYVFCAADPYVGVDLDTCRDPATLSVSRNSKRKSIGAVTLAKRT